MVTGVSVTSWVCNQDGTVFTVYAPRCPECGESDAHEQGGDEDVNVYDLQATELEVAERLGALVPGVVDVHLPDQPDDGDL